MSEEEAVQVEVEKEDAIPEPRALASTNQFDMVREAEARAEMIGKIIPSLVKACHKRNIIDMGGNPYIDDDGCQKIARTIGISYSQPAVDGYYDTDEKTKEKVWVVEVSGEASAFGQSLHEVGACTSSDQFLARRDLPMIQLKIEVKKKAYANWRGRCVRGLLGLKELTWEELEKYGFTRDGANSVDFKKGGKGGRTKSGENTQEAVRDAIMKAVDGNEGAAKELLERATEFPGKDGDTVPGKRNVKELSEKRLSILASKIKKKEKNYLAILEEVRHEFGIGNAEREPGADDDDAGPYPG